MIKEMWVVSCEHCLIQAEPSREGPLGAVANARRVGFTRTYNGVGGKVDLCENCSRRLDPLFQGSAS